jgi:hypothetical protein
MIDYFLKFASEAAAKTALSSRLGTDEQGNLVWPRSYCFPGLQFWLASQDVAGTDSDGNPILTHTYLPGYFIMVSLPNVLAALRDSAPVQIVIDRDLAASRSQGAVIKSNVSVAILQDLRFSPVPAGSDYPFGNMQ